MRYNTVTRSNLGQISSLLVCSYIFDWLIIIASVGVSKVFSDLTPNKRPFSLDNPEISFPFVEHEKISTILLGVLTFAIPALVILVVTILLVPGPAVSRTTPKRLIWQRKLWEWHTGWLGLALSLAVALIITSGMKNLFGKPRPDLISRCNPDVENIGLYVVGGINSTRGGVNLVSAGICQNKDTYIMDDGFRSYPSGHSSFSASGLIYLSLFLASKLGINVPYLSPQAYSEGRTYLSAFPSHTDQDTVGNSRASTSGKSAVEVGGQLGEPLNLNHTMVAARNQAAAAPIWILVVVITPWFASIYISSTRYSDFRHHGFDILFGYLIGTVTAILSFRYYHLPLSQGAGWAWGPRSSGRSFWAGIGVGNYAEGGNRVTEAPRKQLDLEMGPMGQPERHTTNVCGLARD